MFTSYEARSVSHLMLSPTASSLGVYWQPATQQQRSCCLRFYTCINLQTILGWICVIPSNVDLLYMLYCRIWDILDVMFKSFFWFEWSKNTKADQHFCPNLHDTLITRNQIRFLKAVFCCPRNVYSYDMRFMLPNDMYVIDILTSPQWVWITGPITVKCHIDVKMAFSMGNNVIISIRSKTESKFQ